MSKETGGSAFPYSALMPDGPSMYADSEGMSLRDYFAAKVMAALLSNSTFFTAIPDGKKSVLLAAMAYLQADIMLEARK